MVNRLFQEMNCLSFTSPTVHHGECDEYCRLNKHADELKELFLKPELSLEKNYGQVRITKIWFYQRS